MGSALAGYFGSNYGSSGGTAAQAAQATSGADQFDNSDLSGIGNYNQGMTRVSGTYWVTVVTWTASTIAE